MSSIRDPHLIHVWSAREMPFQRRYRKFRERLLAPVLRILQRCGVSPNALSILSMLSLMLIPIGIFLSPPLLLVGYALHFTFDALDGALARSAQRVTARGAYLDVTADYLALVVTVIAARWAFGLSAFWTLLYTVCYILVIVHFLSRNAQGKHPPFPLLRTRFPLFLLVALCVFRVVEPPWLDLFLAAASIYYAAVLLVCLLILRWKLR